MKKVLLEEKVVANVYLYDLDEYDAIGILWRSGKKGFIQRSEEKGFYAIGEIKLGISFESKVFCPSILEYCKQKQISEVFVFDKEKELFKWMSE